MIGVEDLDYAIADVVGQRVDKSGRGSAAAFFSQERLDEPVLKPPVAVNAAACVKYSEQHRPICPRMSDSDQRADAPVG